MNATTQRYPGHDMTNDEVKQWQGTAREILAANNCGDPVGFRTLRERSGEEPCAEGCLAPGSSPHWHLEVIGFQLIGSGGWVEVNVNLEPRVVGRLTSLVD